jgi:hypothetical protein
MDVKLSSDAGFLSSEANQTPARGCARTALVGGASLMHSWVSLPFWGTWRRRVDRLEANREADDRAHDPTPRRRSPHSCQTVYLKDGGALEDVPAMTGQDEALLDPGPTLDHR